MWRVVSNGGTACSRLRIFHAPCSIGLEMLCVKHPPWAGEQRRDSLCDSIRGTQICVVACGLLTSIWCTNLLLRGRRTSSFYPHTQCLKETTPTFARYMFDILLLLPGTNTITTTTTTTTIWQPLYRTTCISRHPIWKLEDFVEAKRTACMSSLTPTIPSYVRHTCTLQFS